MASPLAPDLLRREPTPLQLPLETSQISKPALHLLGVALRTPHRRGRVAGMSLAEVSPVEGTNLVEGGMSQNVGGNQIEILNVAEGMMTVDEGTEAKEVNDEKGIRVRIRLSRVKEL